MMLKLAYFNPYSQQDFFRFFWVLIQRIYLLFSGNLSIKDIASDEIQLVVLIGISASCAIVGSFLVLRKMTMLANALSHTILMGIVVAYLLMMIIGTQGNSQDAMNIQVLMIASLITGVATTFFTEFLTKTINLQEDASIGIVFTTFFAMGIILITLFTRNVHVGTELVMGNVDALHYNDMKNALWIFLINAIIVFLFYKEFKITTFDPGLSRSLGISPIFFNYLLMILTSATAIGGFKAVGVLMILAFLVGPILIARLFTHYLSYLILISIGVGCFASLVGVAFSRHLLTIYQIGLSTGGLIVCIIVLFYFLAVIFAPKQGLVSLFIHQRRLKQKLKN